MNENDGWLICSAELARRLGKSVDWLYRNRSRLEAEGMPPPHPAFQRPLMWSRRAIRRWIDGSPQEQVDQIRQGAGARMAANAQRLAEN